MILNETVGPLLQRQQRQLTRHQEDILTLYEVQEMMMFVMSRAHLEGVFDDVDLSDEQAVVRVQNRIVELQDQYMACQGVARFLSMRDPEE